MQISFIVWLLQHGCHEHTLLYGRKMLTKLQDATDLKETKDVGYQQARNYDAERKQIDSIQIRESYPTPWDSVTISPPKGGCNFAVTFIMLHKQKFFAVTLIWICYIYKSFLFALWGIVDIFCWVFMKCSKAEKEEDVVFYRHPRLP